MPQEYFSFASSFSVLSRVREQAPVPVDPAYPFPPLSFGGSFSQGRPAIIAALRQLAAPDVPALSPFFTVVSGHQEWMVFGSRTYRMPPGEGGSASGCRRGEGAHACLHQLPLPDGRGLRKRGVRLKYKLRTWVHLALPGLRARYPQGVLQKAMPLS